MRQDLSFVAAACFLVAATSAAQPQGGGGGDSKGPEAVACRQKYPEGTLVNKLSSEDGCPMHEFLRQDCERQLAQHRVVIGIGQHCFGPPFTSG